VADSRRAREGEEETRGLDQSEVLYRIRTHTYSLFSIELFFISNSSAEHLSHSLNNREENKRKMKITFDIAGRRVILDNANNQMPTEAELDAISSSSSTTGSTGVFANPFVDRLPIFIPPKTSPPDSLAGIVASAHNSQQQQKQQQQQQSAEAKKTNAKKQKESQAKKQTSKDKENTKPSKTKQTKQTVHRIQHEYFVDEGED